jgi:general secretion pathway protein I
MEYDEKPLDSIPEEKEDNFGTEYPGYKWKLVNPPRSRTGYGWGR